MNSATSFRVCILAYSRIAKTARQVIRELPTNDVEYVVLESGLANEQEASVAEALRLGCDVFIAGPAGAALFSSQYHYPIVSFEVSDLDYLRAIRTAQEQGYRQIGLMRYHHSPSLPLELYSRLLQVKLTELVYEEIPQLYEITKKTDCDILIGPAAVQDAADAAGKASLLIYAGKEAIRTACIKAGELIKQLYDSQRAHLIAESVLHTAQLGVIITNANHHIEFFNDTMQNYTGFSPHQVIDHPLTDILPNIRLKQFLESGYNQMDSFHLINSTMMRCVLRRLTVGRQAGGVLLTFHPNPHNRKKDRKHPQYMVAPVYKLEKITAHSDIMKSLVSLCHHLSPIEYATMILGPEGSGREELAHCLHNASKRANKLCLTLDCATLMDDEAVKVLYGYSQQKHSTEGLLVAAAGGSIIIKHIDLAGPRLLAILRDTLTKRPFFRPGMPAPITLDICFYTIATEMESRHIPSDLRSLLSILILTVPALAQRQEDVEDLFKSYVHQLLPQKRGHRLDASMVSLLATYSWPGNVIELRTVSIRYALRIKNAPNQTALYRYNMLLEAIGKESLKEDIYNRHPALHQRPVIDISDFTDGVETLRRTFHYTYQDIAAELNISRTTLWRILKK